MKIGIDFDNTIVCYDGVFHEAALQRGLIPDNLPLSKNSVRNFMNQNGNKEEFTKLQGYVYGRCMGLVKFYPGFIDFAFKAISKRNELFIISHKTRYPILGPRYDMHAAAMQCIEDHGLFSQTGFLRENVFFEEKKENKIARLKDVNVNVFIDDLPEILSMPGFPVGCRRILFDPYFHHNEKQNFEKSTNWHDLAGVLF